MVFLELAWLLVKAFVIFPLASLGALTIYESYLCQEGEIFSLLFLCENLKFSLHRQETCAIINSVDNQREKEITMKKTFIVLMMIVAMAFGLIGCHDDSQPKELESVDGSSFLIVEYGVNYDIVYHKETKVMYVVSDGEYNRGNFTVMVNADGTPMVYKED